MPTIVLFSLGGAPGVTTLALAAAAAWPEPVPTVVVEADASGGDVAAWRHMPTSPGVVELAAAARTGAAAAPALSFTQVLAGGQRVCLAPVGIERAAGAVSLLARNPGVLVSPGTVTVVDAGRWAPRSPAAHLVAAADVALLVVGSDLAQLKRAQVSLPALQAGVERVGLVVTGTGTHTDQVQEALGAPVLQHVPNDPRSAAFLRGESGLTRPFRRPLLRAARRLGERLAHTAPQSQPTGAGAR